MVIFAVSGLLEAYGAYNKNRKEMHETAHIFKLIAYPVLLLVILHTLHISIASLLVGAGFLGIVVGLAAQTSLGNVFAGISIMYSRPFDPGDKITFTPLSVGVSAPSYPHESMITEITGTVKSIGIIYTKLMRDDWAMMYIPNSSLNQGFIQNHSRVSERNIKVRMDVPINTDVDLFKRRFTARLSRQKEDYERLLGLEVRVSMVSTSQDKGIIITARSKILDYDRISQWLSESAVKTLLEVGKKRRG